MMSLVSANFPNSISAVRMAPVANLSGFLITCRNHLFSKWIHKKYETWEFRAETRLDSVEKGRRGSFKGNLILCLSLTGTMIRQLFSAICQGRRGGTEFTYHHWDFAMLPLMSLSFSFRVSRKVSQSVAWSPIELFCQKAQVEKFSLRFTLQS